MTPCIDNCIKCLRQPRPSRVYLGTAPAVADGTAEFDEVLGYIDRHKLHGKGIGYVDAHLLASAAIGGTKLWTRDKRLHAVAVTLGYALPDSREH